MIDPTFLRPQEALCVFLGHRSKKLWSAVIQTREIQITVPRFQITVPKFQIIVPKFRITVSVTVFEFKKTVPKFQISDSEFEITSFKRPAIAQFSNFVQEKWPNRRLSQRIKHEMYVLFFYTSVPLIFAYQWHVLVDVERARRPTGDDQDEGAARRGEKDLSQH